MSARYLLALGLLVGCASAQPAPKSVENHPRPPPAPPTNATLTKGNEALARGDIVAAARIYAAVPENDPDRAAAVKALEDVQPAVNGVAQLWLKQADRSIKQERYQAAARRLEHLYYNFPLDEPTLAAVEERMVVADQGVVVSRANLEELDKQARPLISENDYAGAVKTLRRASVLAHDIAPDSLLDRERVIAALDQRVAASAKVVEAPPPAPAKEIKPRRRRRGEKEPSPPTAPTPAAPSTGDEAEAEPPSEASHVRELLDEAQGFVQNGAYFNAIADYLRVRELDHGNEAARAALTQLEPKRQELVAQYLDTANRYFLQQDLKSAVPYFRRVLLLDPTNEQAKKGLEMHYNLERIQRERSGR